MRLFQCIFCFRSNGVYFSSSLPELKGIVFTVPVTLLVDETARILSGPEERYGKRQDRNTVDREDWCLLLVHHACKIQMALDMFHISFRTTTGEATYK